MLALQRIQNKAARVVTKLNLSTAGHWLSVHQLAVYQTCVLVYKVLEHKSPQYLFTMFTTDYTRNTRQAARMEIRQDSEVPDLNLTMDGFRWRATMEFNKIPAEIRQMKTLKSFKTSLWKWITTAIPIYR